MGQKKIIIIIDVRKKYRWCAIHCPLLKPGERGKFQVKICLIHTKHEKLNLVFIDVHKYTKFLNERSS